MKEPWHVLDAYETCEWQFQPLYQSLPSWEQEPPSRSCGWYQLFCNNTLMDQHHGSREEQISFTVRQNRQNLGLQVESNEKKAGLVAKWFWKLSLVSPSSLVGIQVTHKTSDIVLDNVYSDHVWGEASAVFSLERLSELVIHEGNI